MISEGEQVVLLLVAAAKFALTKREPNEKAEEMCRRVVRDSKTLTALLKVECPDTFKTLSEKR